RTGVRMTARDAHRRRTDQDCAPPPEQDAHDSPPLVDRRFGLAPGARALGFTGARTYVNETGRLPGPGRASCRICDTRAISALISASSEFPTHPFARPPHRFR